MKNIFIETIEAQYSSPNLKTTQGKNGDIYNIQTGENSHIYNITTKEAINLNNTIPASKITSFTALGDFFSLILETGEIMQIHDGGVDFLGVIEGKIISSSWSPSLEYLVILIEDGSILVMSSSMDLVCEKNILNEEVNDRVNVGWGDISTQYQGREKTPKIQKTIQNGTGSTITWKKDSQLFSVSFWCNGNRSVRTYSQRGVLKSISEDGKYCGSALAWKGDSTLIITSLATEILFVEENGLSYNKSSLYGLNSPIKICWNMESNLLGMLHTGESESILSIWISSNYSWILKKEIRLEGVENLDFYWDNTDRFCLWIECGLKLKKVCLSSPKYTVTLDGLLASIMGKTIGITDYRKVSIPPPYYEKNFDVIETPLDQSFSSDGRFLCVLLSRSISVISIQQNTSRDFPLDIENLKSCVCDEDAVYILHNSNVSSYCLLTGDKKESFYIADACSINIVNDRIVISEKESISVYDKQGNKIENIPTGHEINEVRIESISDRIFILTKNAELYCRNTLVLKHCRSFSLTPDSIIAMTEDNYLTFIDINSYEIKDKRLCELGASIVCVLSDKGSLLLQMPRGNVENLYPDYLIQKLLEIHLETEEYGKAFDLCHRHKIDFNTLILKGGEIFIDKIDNLLKTLSKQKISLLVVAIGRSNTNSLKNLAIRKIRDFCINSDSLIEPLVASLVFSNPQEIETAAKYALESEKALDYLCFLLTPEKLFRSFLGIYDINSAIKAIQKTQNDPMEYKMLTDSLRNENTNIERYNINNYLERYNDALDYLIRIDEVDKCFSDTITYAIDHNSINHLIRIVSNDKERLKEVFKRISEIEMIDGDSTNAVSYLRSAGELDKAYKLAKDSSLWREMIEIGTVLGIPLDRLTLNTFLNGLLSKEKYSEAYSLCIGHTKDLELAFSISFKGGLWKECRNSYFLLNGKITEESFIRNLEDSLEKMIIEIETSKITINQKFVVLTEQCVRNTERISTFLDNLIESTGEETASQFTSRTNSSQKTLVSALSFSSSTTRNTMKAERKRKIWKEPENTIEEMISEFKRLNNLLKEAVPIIDILREFLSISSCITFRDAFNKTRLVYIEIKDLECPFILKGQIQDKIDSLSILSPSTIEAINKYNAALNMKYLEIPEITELSTFIRYL
eukprot:GHVP01041684.1.p1 GENE.GHVP01041684.1~~GHVP01041684.1.p1  ORF type:complete len:1146 (+),score=202.38 GHVP01041684.1:804-4241(+)